MTDSSNELIRLQGVPMSESGKAVVPERHREEYARLKSFPDNPPRKRLGAIFEELGRAEAQVETLTQERDMALVTLANSEEYRRAYQAGKMALYSMGEPFTTAAMQNLPCGEGALDRRFTKLIEMPRVAALEAQVQDALRINSALRESMKEAMDELYPATGYRALNAFDMLNAALTQSAEVPYSNR